MNIYTGAPGGATFGLPETFVVLFVTLGPLNCLRTFAQVTAGVDVSTQRQIAFRAYVIATESIVLSAVVGSFLLGKWRISVGSLGLAAAIILFIVALRSIVALYGDRNDEKPPPVAITAKTAAAIAFPYIATPYGIAVVIVLLALAPQYWLTILGLVVVVMLIDFLLMYFVRPVLRALGLPLSLLGIVLSVFQVALSIQFGLFAIRTIAAQGL